VPLTVIKNYVINDTNTEPTLQTYIDAMVNDPNALVGTDSNSNSTLNVTEVNISMASSVLTGDDVDSTDEIRTILSAIKAIRACAINTSNCSSVDENTYADAHISGVTASNLSAVNAEIDENNSRLDADTIPEIQTIVDNVLGTRPVIGIQTPIADDDIINSQEVTQVLITGTTTAEQGQTVYVSVGATSTTANVSASHGWDVTLDLSAEQEGNLTVSASTTNQIGVESLVASSVITKDTLSIFTISNPANNGTVSSTTPIFSGTGEPNSTITAITTVNGTDHTCNSNVTVDSNGNWQCTIAPELDDNSTHTFAITQVDAVQNASTTNLTITIDTSGGSAPSTPTDDNLYLVASSDTGAYDNDAITKNTSLTIQANCQTGTTQAILYNGSTVLATSTCDTGNPAQFNNITFAGEGTYNLTFAESNTHGTSTAGSPLAVIIDTTLPSTTITAPTENSTTTSTTTLDFSGTSTEDNGFTVVVTDANNSNNTCTATTTSGSNDWNCTITYENAMATGTAVTFNVVQTDLAGNVDSSNPLPQVHVTIGEGGEVEVRSDVNYNSANPDGFTIDDVALAIQKFLQGTSPVGWYESLTTGDVNDCDGVSDGFTIDDVALFKQYYLAADKSSVVGWCATDM